MGCMWSDDKQYSPPLSTRLVYSLIFTNHYIDKDKERSKSDSEVSYKEASPEIERD